MHLKTWQFPYIALGLGVILLIVILVGSADASDGTTRMPLLTLLIACEFAFIVNAIAVYLGVRHTLATGKQPVYITAIVFCVLLAAVFAWLGIGLWPL